MLVGLQRTNGKPSKSCFGMNETSSYCFILGAQKLLQRASIPIPMGRDDSVALFSCYFFCFPE